MDLGRDGTSSAPTFGAIARSFLLGAAITAVFSGSLARLASNAGWIEVLAIGMIVPSFTWVVQLAASAVFLPKRLRRLYLSDLGRICFLGSVALLPAAAFNFCLPFPPAWLSAANVLASVGVMAAVLFRRTSRHGVPTVWPISWCVTITFNMALFLWSSRHWW